MTAVGPIAAPTHGSGFDPFNKGTTRIVACDCHIDRLLAAEESTQCRRVAQPDDRQTAGSELAQPVAVGFTRYHQQAGTLSGNPVAVAAGLATLEKISAPGFFETLTARTQRLVAGLNAAARDAPRVR